MEAAARGTVWRSQAVGRPAFLTALLRGDPQDRVTHHKRKRRPEMESNMLRTQRRAASGGVLVVLATASLGGCAAAREINAVKAEVQSLEQHVGALLVEVDRRINTGGGDVNDPVTGWILAAGYALAPLAFLGYLVAHRFRFFRAFKNRLRGESAGGTFLVSGHAPRP